MNRLWISLWVGGAVLCAANSLSSTGPLDERDANGGATAKEEKILSTRLAEEEAPRAVDAKASVETSREITGSVATVPVRAAKEEPERAQTAPPVASKTARAEPSAGKADTKPAMTAAVDRQQEVKSPEPASKHAGSTERGAKDVSVPERNPKALKQSKKRWAKRGGRRGHLRRWGYGPPDPRIFMMRPYPPYAGRIYAIPPYAVRRYHYW